MNRYRARRLLQLDFSGKVEPLPPRTMAPPGAKMLWGNMGSVDLVVIKTHLSSGCWWNSSTDRSRQRWIRRRPQLRHQPHDFGDQRRGATLASWNTT
jgi:hypothetical protein